MNLTLAIVMSCSQDGCMVSTIEDEEEMEVAYSRLVKDRIQIRRNQLVAVDLDTSPKEIVWRWVRAKVDQVQEKTVVLDNGRSQLIQASLPDDMDLGLEKGDEAWACSTGEDLEAHGKTTTFDHTRMEQLVKYIQPIIEKHYTTR